MITNGGATKLAAAYGDASGQSGAAVAYDKSGNLLVTGTFAGSINFGGTTLTSSGGDDAFVAKFNPAGQLLWAKKFGDSDVQTASSIGVDANGNVYVTGNFKGAINFGGGNLNAAGALFVDVYLAKLGSDGGHVWSKSFGDTNVQNVRSMAVDTAGNIIITGFFQNDINFGGATLTSAGLYDVFLAKFTTDGMHQWSRRFGDAAGDQNGRAVVLDSTGNVYLAGDIGGSIDFGGGVMTATATKVAFATKFDPLGNATWAKLSVGMGTDRATATAIAVGPAGEVLVGGNFRGNFDLGGGSIVNPNVDDAFITLFDAAGMHTLTQSFGDTQSQTVTGVAVAANGDLIATGNFSGSIDVGTGMPITSAGAFDGFLARWDAKGCPVWVRTYPGAMTQLTQGLALDPTTGGFALTGLFNGAVDFGTGMLTAAGDDIFVLSANP